MAILKLIPTCKDYIWGGTKLRERYNKDFPGERIAESWELSCHPDGPCRIAGGEADGMTLADWIGQQGEDVLGTNCRDLAEFPVLVKFIDAKGDLSVQVHPDDETAMALEGQSGKTEMWYILEADEDAFLYCGFSRDITPEEYRQHIADGTLTAVLRKRPVRKGDVIFIPAGTIHAICRGIVLAEVQQSSNVTYRVFDYNRPGADGKPRQLHVDKALRVTELSSAIPSADTDGHLIRCRYFTVDAIVPGAAQCCDERSFVSLLITDGEGTVSCGSESVFCRRGDSLFLPAASGTFMLSGSVEGLIIRAGAC